MPTIVDVSRSANT